MSDESDEMQATVGKTIESVEPTTGRHWDGSTVEDGLLVKFTDGSSVELIGLSTQDHGYVLVDVQLGLSSDGAFG